MLSQEVLDGNAFNFQCTASGCTYSKRDVCGIVLHMRTHFVYETAKEEMPTATFSCKDGKYQCWECNRKTNNRISFWEHVRHHILPLPYRCHCGTAVASIPDLRKHSSVAHPKTPLQMYFEDTGGLLEEISRLIGPQKRTFWFPQRTRLACAEVENLSDLSVASVSGGVLNECTSKTNRATDVTRTGNFAPRILVRRANAETQQNENCSVVPSENGSGLGKGPGSASASVLEFSAEFNYINAFSYSTDTAERDSNAFLVLNVPDDNFEETRTDCLGDSFQANTKRCEIWPKNGRRSPPSGNMLNLRSFDNYFLTPHNTDSSCTSRDIALSNISPPIVNESNSQVQAESETELLTVFSRATTCDSEISPNSQLNTTTSELERLFSDDPTPSSGPGKFVFRDGNFKCLTCLNWETVSEQLFRKHVWQHVHSFSEICQKSECESDDCPLVSGLVMLVKNVSVLQSMDTSEPGSNTVHQVYPCSSTPSSRLSNVGKASNTPPSERSELENYFDVEPSSPTGENFEAQKENSVTKTEKGIENLSQRSAEQLRFSAPSLLSLRSKACRHLTFNRDVVGDSPGNGEKLRKDDTCIDASDNGEDVARVRETELNCNEPEYEIFGSENTCSSVSGDDTISAHRRKQMLMIKQDINQPVEYCRYSRDSTPLSTVCDKCSYTCNCSVQLTWHMKSCHPSIAIKKRKDFCCTECGFSDVSKQTLIWHMAHHVGQHTLKVFGCKYCSRQSTYMSRIMKHIYHAHSGKVMEVTRESTNIAYMDGIFKCPFCRSGYPWGSLFFRHIEIQHNLKQLADYLAATSRRKCCPESIEFPKYLILNVKADEDNQSFMGVNDCDGSAAQSCTENENISMIQQHRENTVDSIKSQHSKNHTETDDRSSVDPVSDMTSDSTNAGFGSAKCRVRNTNETSGDLGKCKRKGVQMCAETSQKHSKNSELPTGSISHWKLRPYLGKSTQNDLIVYNSTKRRVKAYQSPRATKRSFLSAPSRIPTLPRNLENATASDFEKSLPDQFIFSQAIKCPKCYYTDRIRLNLIRHYNGHLTDASKVGEMNESSSNLQRNTGDWLTFNLWNPKISDKKIKESDNLVANKIKDHGSVSVENDKDAASRRKRSEKRMHTAKRAKLTGKAHKLDPEGSKESHDIAEATNGGSVSTTGNLTSGRCLTAGNDVEKTSTSFGSPPAFGQFLQNHAKKVMAVFSCVSCSTTFSSETDYNKHAEVVHPSTYYLCRCCGSMIRGLSNVQVHYKERHPRSPVLVDEWVSANKDSRKRIRQFSEVSDVGLPAKKTKIAKMDGENAQSPDKPDSEVESLPKEQKWSSFYGAKLRKQLPSSTGPNPTVGTTSAEFSTLNMASKASSSSSSQAACSTVVSTIHIPSTGGDTVNAVGAATCELTTGMAGHTTAATGFPPELGGNNLLAALVSNFLAANMMASQTAPLTQVPSMQVPASIPSTVEPSTPAVMAGQLPVPGMQPVVDTSGFTNLLASLLMANLAAGTGLTTPTSYPNENAANPRNSAYPFQPGANNLNLLGATTNNPQIVPSVAELIKEAFNPSNRSNMYNMCTPASGVNGQNSISTAEVSKDLPNLSHASILVPDATSSATHDSCDDNSRQSFCSFNSGSKPVYTASSGSKRKQFSDHENLYSSEAESTISIASQRSHNSKSSRSTTTSKKSSKPGVGTRKRKVKKNQFLRCSPENYATDFERCSSRSSLSTIDLTHGELPCKNSSPSSVAEMFAVRAIQMCCNRCEYKTKKLKHFEKHLAVHFDHRQQPSVDPKLWKPVRQKCGFCNFQTYLDEEFEEHVAIHMIKKPYQCAYCSFSGFTKASINRHLSRLHPKLEPKFEKNQNLRLKQTALRTAATKVSLNPVVKVTNVLKLNRKALESLCTKYSLAKLNLKCK